MSEVEVSGIEVYRSFKEVIKIDTSYCFGVLDGKNFAIARTTRGNNVVFIRWCKGKMPYSSNKNIFGKKAEKLLNMVLERIPNIPENETLIEEMKCMIEKNKNASARFGISNDDIKDISDKSLLDEKKKKELAFQKFMTDKAVYEQKNAAKKAEKEALKAQKLAEKQRLKEQRILEEKKRIQKARALKIMKEEERVYPQMIFNQPENETPTIFVDGNTAIILGHINKNFFRIKLSDKNPSFFIIQNDEKVRKMSIAELQQILVAINENPNHNEEHDVVLERVASDYDKFRQLKFPENKNVQKEKIAISKNILIQKGLLTHQNVIG